MSMEYLDFSSSDVAIIVDNGLELIQITIGGTSALMAVEKNELNNIDVEHFTEIVKNK